MVGMLLEGKVDKKKKQREGDATSSLQTTHNLTKQKKKNNKTEFAVHPGHVGAPKSVGRGCTLPLGELVFPLCFLFIIQNEIENHHHHHQGTLLQIHTKARA